jgi:uncharacterized membrane protein
VALAVGACTIVFSATYLLVMYSALPDILPVHFMRNGNPNGWQYKNHLRVLTPVFVQIALGMTLAAVALLLLSRPHGEQDQNAPDVRAASTAAEAVSLLALIWIVFQAYAAVALTSMWRRGHGDLGTEYSVVEVAGLLLTVVVAVRALFGLGRPVPRPFVSEHWRFGQLYKNPLDPALFVPTRDGTRWTLNFGRPVAALLMAVLLGMGIIGPVVILALSLR